MTVSASGVYLDTSFLLPYYISEATSSAVDKVLTSLNNMFVSSWTRVEFTSALARQVRMGGFDPQQAKVYLEAFDQDLQQSYHLLTVHDSDYTLATHLLLRHPALGLRAGDALHLAVTMNHKLTLYSLDTTFINAAHQLGHAATDASVR